MKKTILFGERVKKTDDNQFGWHCLYDGRAESPEVAKDSLLGKKSVIFFPGDGTYTAKGANGCCKAIQCMLLLAGIDRKAMPHLYGLAYAGGRQDKHRYHILTQLKQAHFGAEYVPDEASLETMNYYQPFFNTYIMPLIVDAKGQPRPIAEIRQNLQNITFASHCHGGFMAWQIEKMMADKLAEIYPKEMPELMSNVRMIHFASRRPKGQSFAKHLDIVSQNDYMYADESTLEYDDLHKQMHRGPLAKESALISVSPNEEVLLLKKLTSTDPEEGDEDPDHSEVLNIFAGEIKNAIPENEPAIQMVRQLLRHFVEHPEDKKDLISQVTAINPTFANENIQRGQALLRKTQEQEKIHRGLLSLFSRWGAHLDRREKQHTYFGALDTSANEMLRERHDDGRFLYHDLEERYKQTKNCRSLLNYLKDTGVKTIPKNEQGELAILAVQNADWKLLEQLKFVEKKQLFKIMQIIQPQDLHHLLPILLSDSNDLRTMSPTLEQLVKKVQQVKNFKHKNQLITFLTDILWLAEGDTSKELLKRASIKGKKSLKALFSAQRQKKADELRVIMRERDAIAPDLTIKEMDLAKACELSVEQFRLYKAQKKSNPKLNIGAFYASLRKKERVSQQP